ncbi:MAG: metal ABC transporter permease, partial [Planctomycetota bacterium]
MSELFQAMALPFTACLLLVGIHVYLGIHIIARKVIFVDLALAQIAALGAIWGVLLGYGFHEDPWIVKAFSLLFTILGALLFSMTRPRDRRVPHEAIIGITYAVALAATILASSHLPHGSDEIRDLLAGSILWVEGHTLAITGLLYLGIGGFHLLFRRQFFELSFREEGLAGPLERERLWDFLFYFSFGLVVTSSVAIAGVLLVFSYLVIPALIGVLLAPTLRARLAVGWGVGSLMSL